MRWTEQRNFEAVLDMLADGRLDVAPLISHRFALEEAEKAYALIAGEEASLGVLIDYPGPSQRPDSELRVPTVALASQPRSGGGVSLGFIGSGNHARAVLAPAFRASGARLATVASARGVSGVHAGRKFGFEKATTDAAEVFGDPVIDAVAIATRHDSHASLVRQALAAGKHVFVEKPLALSLTEVDEIDAAYRDAVQAGRGPILAVGFNRRFAPHVRKMKELLAGVKQPKTFVMLVNAGALPADHWTQDAEIGGGRIVGEACHFIDLIRFLAGAPIVEHYAAVMDSPSGDTATVSLTFADGSVGTVHYFANGFRAFPKERLEVFAAGRILQLENFRRLRGFGWPGFRTMRLWRQDKGQRACAAAFVRAIEEGGPPPIPYDEILEVARVSIEAAAKLRA